MPKTPLEFRRQAMGENVPDPHPGPGLSTRTISENTRRLWKTPPELGRFSATGRVSGRQIHCTE